MLPTAPRHFIETPGLPGAGLPSDRLAQVAARRAFVALKASFQHSLDTVEGSEGEWLRRQVRAAEEATDLWLLRAPVFAALAGNSLDRRQQRRTLRRSLEALFPQVSEPASAFSPF